jgi:catechol 2,3-dioxygenase-like lactoylglutathione lyase family enzyme
MQRVEAINHVGLVVKDLPTAERFYIDVLGLWRGDAHQFASGWQELRSASRASHRAPTTASIPL